MKRTVGIVTVVPSPYQRDLFAALAAREEIDLCVRYMEAAAPDSPWPEKPLASYEKILPGFWFPLGSARCHVNWGLRDVLDCDVVILNSLMSITAQRLMRFNLRNRRWIFWGERLGPRRTGWHQALLAPLRRATAIAGIGSRATADYKSRFPGSNHFCIPYYCDLARFLALPERRKYAGDPVFFFCGQMIARKGVDLLIEAFTRVGLAHPKARLLLVGREAELPQMMNDLPPDIRNRIDYRGFRSPDELPAFFGEADVFILPSRYDGWGVVVNQALGAGLPILCSDAVGAGYDLVEPEKNGVRFPTGDADALCAAMLRCASEPDLVRRWGARSREAASAWLPEAGARRWLEVFRAVSES